MLAYVSESETTGEAGWQGGGVPAICREYTGSGFDGEVRPLCVCQGGVSIYEAIEDPESATGRTECLSPGAGGS